MANHGRSSDARYPEGQYPPGRGRPADPPPGWRPGGQAQARPEPPEELPPPEWADPATGRRWTTSWRIPPTSEQPMLPTPPRERPAPPPGRRATGAMPLRETGGWPAAPSPADATRTVGTVRATAANRALDPTRTTGAMRATGAQPTTDANSADATRTTGGVRTSGAMRTAKPIAPGTGKARIVLPVVVLAVIALGLVGVGYLWWQNTVFLHTPGAVLTDIGEILGLLAGYGVVVLVALMSRLPPLERGIGTDRLARWHAMGGRYIVSLVVAHGLLILWGYATETHTALTSETATLLTQYPDVLMATVAGFLLLGVGIVSMRAARRRVRYETWYYLHL